MLALRDLLKPERLTAIVDVVDGEPEDRPPYRRMLEEGVCAVRSIRRDELDARPCDLLKVSVPWRRAMLEMWPDKVAVQAAAAFFPEYTFGVLDSGLRMEGFALHCFAGAAIVPIPCNSPIPHPDPHQFGQADVVYIRDIARPMGAEQWKHLALIAHHVCGSFDLAMHCIDRLISLGAIPSDSDRQYQRILETL